MQYFIITGDYQYKDPYTGKIETVPMMVWSLSGEAWTEERLRAKRYKTRRIAEAAVERLKKKPSFGKAKNITVEEVITVNS